MLLGGSNNYHLEKITLGEGETYRITTGSYDRDYGIGPVWDIIEKTRGVPPPVHKRPQNLYSQISKYAKEMVSS